MPYAQEYYLKLAARKSIERGGHAFPTPLLDRTSRVACAFKQLEPASQLEEIEYAVYELLERAADLRRQGAGQ